MHPLLQTISRFDGGLSDDSREPDFTKASLLKHFNPFSNPFRLTPYRSTEADHATGVSATDAKQYDIRHFQFASTGLLYGLGKNGSGYPKVLRKADPTTGNWLASDGSAAATAIGEGNAARVLGCFFEWASNFWFFQGTNQVAKVLISSGVITNSVNTVGETITTVAQGLVAPDGNAYMFYNNKVVKVSPAGVVTDNVAPTIPSDMRITSATVYGNYIAIACAFGTSATSLPTGRSKVFLWDMSSTTLWSDVVDFGEGSLNAVGNVEGMLCGVSDQYLSDPVGLLRGSMVVRLWSGGTPQVIKEVVANQTVPTTTQRRFLNEVVIKGNKMYWVASVPFGASTSTESTHHLGIWCFGRKNAGANFALTLDYIEEGIDTSNFFIRSFGNAGNYWFINHSADGSISKTDDAANFTFTSIYETQVINFSDSSITKRLKGVTVTTVPLPTAGQVVLKYKLDAESSFTTIFTDTTDNDISHTAINIESSGVFLPEFKEIILRVESTGNAEITGIKIKAEVIDKDIV